jgi:hypothetical protein
MVLRIPIATTECLEHQLVGAMAAPITYRHVSLARREKRRFRNAVGRVLAAKFRTLRKSSGVTMRASKARSPVDVVLMDPIEQMWRCLLDDIIAVFLTALLSVRERRRQSHKILSLRDDYFSEWPGIRKPLGSTWPWNIKPSLVVLWGVCWMFHPGDDLVPKPLIRVRTRDLLADPAVWEWLDRDPLLQGMLSILLLIFIHRDISPKKLY